MISSGPYLLENQTPLASADRLYFLPTPANCNSLLMDHIFTLLINRPQNIYQLQDTHTHTQTLFSYVLR